MRGGIISTCLFVLLAALSTSDALAGPSGGIEGDCRNFRFLDQLGMKTADKQGQLVFTLHDGAAVYQNATGGDPAKTLDFSSPVFVKGLASDDDHPDERVQVGLTLDGASETYWMNRADLLCSFRALKDPNTGLERKALIRTKTTEREDGVVQAITAYRNPEGSGDDLLPGRQLSRFTTYLIFAESPNAYLLTDKFNLSSAQDRLVGWVKKDDVLNWNWSIGLRPPRDLKNADGSTITICGYDSPTDRSNCHPILGGDSWFKSDLRLPVLDVTDDYYHVVAAASGLEGAQVVNGKLIIKKEMMDKITIGPEQKLGINKDMITSQNNIDVFFLIDGTKSMGPFIDAIRGNGSSPGVVQKIVSELERKGGGATVRAGFRVFRDSSNGRAGIDEGVELNNGNCEEETPEGRAEDRKRFEEGLDQIVTSNEESDDFSENLLGGLETAASDIYGCPGHSKILFVISDAGYDPQMQASRGQAPLDSETVAKDLVDQTQKLLVFFIRTPKRDRSDFRSDASFKNYSAAYDDYKAWSDEIIPHILERDAKIGATIDPSKPAPKPQDFFLDMDALNRGGEVSDGLVDLITDRVKAWAMPEIINEIMIDLNGGQALETIIKRLAREKQDVPIFFLSQIQRTACANNEQLCKQRILDGIFDLYIPRDQPVVLEAWLTADKLAAWKLVLQPIVEGGWSVPEQREAVGQALRNSMATVLNLPAPDDLKETIGDYMKRSGLIPGPGKTPLLRYTFEQIANAQELPACELDRLRAWLAASDKMLGYALLQQLSSYQLDKERGDCPGMTAQGAAIPLILGDPEPVLPGPDPSVYQLGRHYLGEMIFWVPHHYLP